MASYEIVVDEARRTLIAKSEGFWDIDTTRAYLDEMAVAARRVARDGACSWWLIDLSNSTLQSREVADLLGAALPRLFPPDVVVAVVTPSTLQSLQAKRVADDDRHQYFATHVAAEAWLESRGKAP